MLNDVEKLQGHCSLRKNPARFGGNGYWGASWARRRQSLGYYRNLRTTVSAAHYIAFVMMQLNPVRPFLFVRTNCMPSRFAATLAIDRPRPVPDDVVPRPR